MQIIERQALSSSVPPIKMQWNPTSNNRECDKIVRAVLCWKVGGALDGNGLFAQREPISVMV